jgi:exonuclease III
LNIVSLQKHYLDLKCDPFLLQSDILCLNETRLRETTDLNEFAIPGYTLQALYGAPHGIAIYFRHTFLLICHEMIVEPTYQILHIVFSDFDIFAIYNSRASNKNDFVSRLASLVQKRKQTFILGNTNENVSGEGVICSSLQALGFRQHVHTPTHWQGNTLDHIYSNSTGDLEWIDDAIVKSCYFSDHDSVSLNVHWKDPQS